MRATVLAICGAACLGFSTSAEPAERSVTVGAGSYAVMLPPQAKRPPAEIFKTENVAGPMPTNDWWSSVAWLRYSERHYPHPLAVQASGTGLRVHYPGNRITAGARAIMGSMSPAGDDLTLGHSIIPEFPDARVDGFSDWFVRVRFAVGRRGMTVSYGHGSPFVYAEYEGGDPKIEFGRMPIVWSGSPQSPVLGITVGDNHYGLFGPTGSTWTGLGSRTVVNRTGGKAYFSIALLPGKSEKMLALFARYAYAHVTDTKIAWQYDPKSSMVRTTFTLTTKPLEGQATDTLFALYPHQWRYAPIERYICPLNSVRGVMKLAAGSSFTTRVPFCGVLPSIPLTGNRDKRRLDVFLDREAERPREGTKDTYWEGKHLGKLATLAPLAEQSGNTDAAAAFHEELRRRLENWCTATTPRGEVKSSGLFYYDDRWGSLIGYPASYASDVDLNDHHFHYGYFIRAAAELARVDPEWAASDRWGGMVELLARDIAAPRRDDPKFPFLRNFDPYAGHSWASGHAKFADGNNNESSSEAMNAWCAMILWGQATGDVTLRDLGVFLYTTEMTAIHEYWFDVHDENHPADYAPAVVTMVWGGKGANETWFSANPEAVYGINWLPMHGGSLYLGHYPDYVEKNYRALVAANNGTNWDQWADLIWMVRALDDPQDALKQYNAQQEKYPAEAGNSQANTYAWLHALDALGHVDRTVTADYPLVAVFGKGDRRSYIVYNMENGRRTVTFSDGTKVSAESKGFVVQHEE